MKVSDIQTEVQTFADNTLTVSNAKAVSAMKLALNIIAERNGYDYQIASAAYTADTWNTSVLPVDVIQVTGVNIDDDYLTEYLDYEVKNQRDILFRDTDEYIIHYSKLPDEPTAVDSTLYVHPKYKMALWEFMLSYCRLSKWDGDDNLGQQLLADFENRVEKIWRSINSSGPLQMAVIR